MEATAKHWTDYTGGVSVNVDVTLTENDVQAILEVTPADVDDADAVAQYVSDRMAESVRFAIGIGKMEGASRVV